MYRFTGIILLLFVSEILFAQHEKLHTVLQKGHSEVVKTASYSPDGKLVATGSRDRSIKLWDTESGLEIKSFFGFDHTVNALEFSADNKLLAVSSADKYSRILEISTGREIWKSPEHKEYVTAVALFAEKHWIAEGGYDRNMVVYNYLTNDTVSTIKVNPDKGVGTGIYIQFSSDGSYLAVGEDNRKAMVYSTRTWERVYEFQPSTGFCGGCGTAIDFSMDSKYFAKVSSRDTAIVYDLETGVKKYNLKSGVRDIRSIAFHHNGESVLLANEDSVWLFSMVSGNLFSAFKPGVKEINEVRFHPVENKILISGNDNRASVWSFSGQELTEFSGLLNSRDKGGIAYDPNNYWESHIARYLKFRNKVYLTRDGEHLLRGKAGKRARLWSVKTGKIEMEYIGHEKAVTCFDVTNDDRYIFTGSADGGIRSWELSSGILDMVYKGHREPVFDIKISNNHRLLASSSWDGYVMVWNIETGERIALMNLENVAAYSIEFTPNDAYLVLGKLDKTLELREIDTGRKVREFIGHTDYVNGIVWSDNRDEFFSLGNEGMLISWSLSTGLINRKFRQKGAVHAMSIKSGDELITAGEDRIIRIWDRKNGFVKVEMFGHQSAITSLNYVDGLMVSGDIDGVIKFWKDGEKEYFFEQMQIGLSDWLSIAANGSFYGTEGAMNNVHFVKGLRVYKLDQFYDEFFNPLLMPELFEASASKNKRNIEGSLHKSPPPELKFARTPEFAEDEVELTLRIQNKGGGMKDLQLFHNGKRMDMNSVKLNMLENTAEQQILKFKVELVGGHNVISARAYSHKNIASAIVEVDVQSNNTKAGSVCYVLAVGINEYKNPALSLNYARKDAEAFVKALETVGEGIYKGISVKELYDQEATRENILNQLDTLISKAQINDVVLIYYAGHGSVVDDEFFLIPSELTRLYESRSMEKAINASEVLVKLQQIKALKQVVIFDACQSGKSLDVFSARGAAEEKAIAQLSRSAGVHILAAAGSEQYAGEYEELGHGLFTYALLEALSGQSSEQNGDRKVSIYEIKGYLDERVPELSFKYKGLPQYPHSFSRGQDFPVGVIK